MIAEGRVSPAAVEYNELPWKYSAGTPNILGVIVSAQALRFAVDLVGAAGYPGYFRTETAFPGRDLGHDGRDRQPHPHPHRDRSAGVAAVPGLTIYGPGSALRRSPLVAFNVAAGIRSTWPRR